MPPARRAPEVAGPLSRPGVGRLRHRPDPRLPLVRGHRAADRAAERGGPSGTAPAYGRDRLLGGLRAAGGRALPARLGRTAERIRDVLPGDGPRLGFRGVAALHPGRGCRTPQPYRRGHPHRRTHPHRERVARRRDPSCDGDGRAGRGSPLSHRLTRSPRPDPDRRHRHRPAGHHRPAAPARPAQPGPRHRGQNAVRRQTAHTRGADAQGRPAGGVHRGGHTGGVDRQCRTRGLPGRAGGPDQRPQIRSRQPHFGPGAPCRKGDHRGGQYGRFRLAGRVPGGSGRGLAGLRERVDVLGGDFTAGRQTAGGFVVRARIPAGSPS